MFLGMSRFLSISTLKMLSSVVEFLFFLMFCESVVSPFSMVLIQILRLTSVSSAQHCCSWLLGIAAACSEMGEFFISVLLFTLISITKNM